MQQLGKSEVLENTVRGDGDAVWASQVWGERFLRVGGGTADGAGHSWTQAPVDMIVAVGYMSNG